MRTTLTLEPDVARLIEDAAHRQRRPIKQIVNDALRRGLAPEGSQVVRKPFRVHAHRTSLRAGVDSASLNRLVDDLDEEAAMERLVGAP